MPPKALSSAKLTYLRQHGHALPERIDVGTWSKFRAAPISSTNSEKVDFVSVGSNDLFQFLFAVDRGNAKGLRAVRYHVRADHAGVARDRTESKCSEQISLAVRRDGGKTARRAGADRMGYRSLSMSATGHGPVKAMILDLDAKKAEAMMLPLLDAPSGSVSIRES